MLGMLLLGGATFLNCAVTKIIEFNKDAQFSQINNFFNPISRRLRYLAKRKVDL